MATIYTSNTMEQRAVIGVDYTCSVIRSIGSNNQRPALSLFQGTLESAGLTGSFSYVDEATVRVFTVTITGVPTATGSFYCFLPFKLGTQDYQWNVIVHVDEGIPPKITTENIAEFKENSECSISLQATGTTPITWSIIDGELPQGLTLDSETGVISGRPY